MNKFPNHFYWGGATSASQIEGAHIKDQRGYSKLDYLTAGSKKEPRYVTCVNEQGDIKKIPQFLDTPKGYEEKILEDVYYPNHKAIDFYHNYKEDIKLFAELGFKMFRLSISWSRIFPTGLEDTPNIDGLEFYRNVFLELKNYNIEPLVTISHYDTPLVLDKKYGWSTRTMIDYFMKYCSVIFNEYKGLVKYWLTFNELNTILLVPELLPTSLVSEELINSAYLKLHNQFIASAKAVLLAKEIDENYQVGCMLCGSMSYPMTCNPKDVLENQKKYMKKNYYCGDVMMKGEYPHFTQSLWNKSNFRMEISEEDQAILKAGVVDFCSMSYYSSSCVTTDTSIEKSSGNFTIGSKNPYLEYSKWGWSSDPDGLRIYLNDMYARYNIPMMVVENGLGADDEFVDGTVHDDYRIDYLSKHIQAMSEAIEDGVDLVAYTAWACIDSISASTGEMDKRYGFIYVDVDNEGNGSYERYKKDSFEWYKKVIQSNGVIT